MIICCKLKPGEPLIEERLSQDLSLSRTPLREAIHMLGQEGFVKTIPHKGGFVARLSAEDIMEIFFIREALEGLAAEIAAERISPPALSELNSLFENLGRTMREKVAVGIGTRAEAVAVGIDGGIGAGIGVNAGDQIHDVVLETVKNRRMLDILALYREQLGWLKNLASILPGRLIKSFEEHKIILDALNRQDSQKARLAMCQHIRSTQKDLLASYSVNFI